MSCNRHCPNIRVDMARFRSCPIPQRICVAASDLAVDRHDPLSSAQGAAVYDQWLFSKYHGDALIHPEFTSCEWAKDLVPN